MVQENISYLIHPAAAARDDGEGRVNLDKVALQAPFGIHVVDEVSAPAQAILHPRSLEIVVLGPLVLGSEGASRVLDLVLQSLKSAADSEERHEGGIGEVLEHLFLGIRVLEGRVDPGQLGVIDVKHLVPPL